MEPFFAALLQGRVLAGRCPVCGDTRVPPRATCAIDGAATDLIEVPPTGEVVRLTTGSANALLAPPLADAVFAELRITGAHNRLIARIDPTQGGVLPGSRVRLALPNQPLRHPIQALVFVLDSSPAPTKRPLARQRPAADGSATVPAEFGANSGQG